MPTTRRSSLAGSNYQICPPQLFPSAIPCSIALCRPRTQRNASTASSTAATILRLEDLLPQRAATRNAVRKPARKLLHLPHAIPMPLLPRHLPRSSDRRRPRSLRRFFDAISSTSISKYVLIIR